MYMGVIGTNPGGDILRELRGARVLITGLTADAGVDLARAFAELGARLVVHTTDLSQEITALVALLSQSASEIKLYTDAMTSAEDSVRFAQTAAQAFGGLDAVINIASITSNDMAAVASEREVEDLVSAKLSPLAHLTRVAANRMRVVLSEGMILNVLTMPQPETRAEQAVATVLRGTLAAMTSGEARAWADQAIRINAIGPRIFADPSLPPGACLTNEPDIAALAIYLASRRGKNLSGHVFDSEGVARRNC
jgi:3-oxoacyl-[acyl-carrier protein] reductase